MARLITEIVGRHAGKRIVVMGGGPSLPAAIDGLQADVWISANQHGAKLLQSQGRRVDYLYAADVYHQVLRNKGQKLHMRELLAEYAAPIITKRWYGDYRIPTSLFPITGNSGLQAIGAAVLLGGNPIIVCGIDMYRTTGTYWHDHNGASSGLKRPIEDIDKVISECAAAVAGQNIRRIGCERLPFPVYDPGEVFDRQPPLPGWASQIAQAQAQEWRVRWSFHQHGEPFKGRDTILLTTEEAGAARMSPRLTPINPAHGQQEPQRPRRAIINTRVRSQPPQR